MIGGSTKASVEEIEAGSELALAEAIANINGVDGQSVAGLLDAYLDAAISSRSSHSWDPDGVIPTTGTLATQSDIGGGGIDWSSKTVQVRPLPVGNTNVGVDSTNSSTDSVSAQLINGSGYTVDPGYGTYTIYGEIDVQGGFGVDWNSVDGHLVVDDTTVQSVNFTGSGGKSSGTASWTTPIQFLDLARFNSSVEVKMVVDWQNSSEGTDNDLTVEMRAPSDYFPEVLLD